MKQCCKCGTTEQLCTHNLNNFCIYCLSTLLDIPAKKIFEENVREEFKYLLKKI